MDGSVLATLNFFSMGLWLSIKQLDNILHRNRKTFGK